MDDHRVKDAPAGVPALEPDEPPPLPAPASRLLDLRRPTWALVLRLAWPTLLQQLLVFAVNLFDGLLAGRFQNVGQAEQIATQAAQTTANYLAWFLSSCTILVSVGATALVARLLGAGDRRGAGHAANQSILLAAVLGLGGGAALLAGLPYLLEALQLRGDEAVYAAAFLRPLFVLLTLQVVESAGVACLLGAGDTLTGMVVLGGVAVVNVPLTWLFFHGLGPVPAWGFAGIGLGTAVAHALGGAAVLAVLVRGRVGLRLRAGLLWPNGDLIKRLLWVSLPAGFDSLSVTLGHLWFLAIVNHALGEADQAAHGIAIRWEALGFLSGAAFGAAAMALVGQNLGAGQPGRAAQQRLDGVGAGGTLDGGHGRRVLRAGAGNVRSLLSEAGTGGHRAGRRAGAAAGGPGAAGAGRDQHHHRLAARGRRHARARCSSPGSASSPCASRWLTC